MSKAKLEKDYHDFILQIEKLAEEEINSNKEKVEGIKEEVKKIGEAVELSLKDKEGKVAGKKVNSQK